MTGNLLAGRYAVGDVLGTGGMAEVRDGWDTRLHRAVAVKLLHPMFAARPDLRGRFADEARAAAALSHPNIVSVHDFGEHEGTPFIVMERLPGKTLADLMEQGPLAPQQVRAILDQVLAALHVAHTAGVLHRDIKPANILLSADGVKVADFGIAKTGASNLSMTGQIVGTMSYLSPERVIGAPASAADDLYATGLVAYEALLGRPVYRQDTPVGLARAITDHPLPPVTTVRADVDPVTAGVVDGAVARDRGARFTSAAQMRAALTGSPHRPATLVLEQPVQHPQVVEKRSRAGKYAVAASILAAFAIAVVALATGPFSSSPAPEPVSTSTSVTPPPPPSTTVAPPPSVQQAPDHGPKPKKPKGEGHPGRGAGNGD